MSAGIVMPRYQCQLCPMSLDSNDQLSAHQAEHRGRLPYKCPGCPSEFLLREELHAHIRERHKDERIYACHLCPLSLKKQAHLTAHLTVHAGGFPYKCHVCGKGFRVRRMLTNHLRKKHVPKRKRRGTLRV